MFIKLNLQNINFDIDNVGRPTLYCMFENILNISTCQFKIIVQYFLLLLFKKKKLYLRSAYHLLQIAIIKLRHLSQNKAVYV